MAKRIMPKSNIPNPPNPISGLRVFSREEIAHRRKLREQGKLVDKPIDLLPADAHRKRKRYSVTLDSAVVTYARKLGRGNLSRGIERALDERIERNQSQKGIS